VCEADTDFGGGFILHAVTLVEQGRTLDDGLERNLDCGGTSPTRNVKGRMAQAGRVTIGSRFDRSDSPDWSFKIPVAPGVYTLYASTPDRIVIRRGIDATRNVSLAAINTNTEGAELAPFTFELSNAAPDAEVNVAVRIEQQSSTFPGTMYYGPPEGAKLVPTNVLVPDDNQTVSVLTDSFTFEDGFTRDASLASRRPFRIGDDATWTMPAQIEGVHWTTGASPAVSWTSLPPLTVLIADVSGNAPGQPDPISYSADLSPSFRATGAHGIVFDTDLPGYKPEWLIDDSLGYNRDVFVQRYANPLEPEHGVIDSSEVIDVIDPTAPAAANARAAAPRSTPDIESLSRAHRIAK
jgi:hypothetical protein